MSAPVFNIGDSVMLDTKRILDIRFLLETTKIKVRRLDGERLLIDNVQERTGYAAICTLQRETGEILEFRVSEDFLLPYHAEFDMDEISDDEFAFLLRNEH